MKKIILLLLVFTGINLHAQRKVEREVNYENQLVDVEFEFASQIEIKTWNNPLIKVEATINTENKKYTEMFDVRIEDNEGLIKIESNTKELFKLHRKENEDSPMVYRKGLDHEFNYVINVPEGVKMKISSITANLFSKFIKGDIQIDLVSGDIIIEKQKGNLDLNTVAGKIDVVYSKASLMAKTVAGNIYTDDKLNLKRKEKLIGQEVSLDLDNVENSLSLTTVNGDIYLK